MRRAQAIGRWQLIERQFVEIYVLRALCHTRVEVVWTSGRLLTVAVVVGRSHGKQKERAPLAVPTGCAPYAVDIVLVGFGQVIVHYVVDVGNVDAPACEVGGNENVG